MAVRNETPGQTNRAWLIALALVALFAVALFVRAYWNLDAATEGGTFVLSGGSDPYYHKHAVDAIQERGYHTLVQDPMLNYPYGSVNPNPPLFEWTIAVVGQFLAPFFGGDVATSTWHATLWTAPVFGALTVFPVYFLGLALFDSRRIGLLAALLWTLSTSAIDAAGIGAADHDATIMFFATLAFLFYAQSIRLFRGDGNWVTNWRDGGAIGRGLGTLLRGRALGFGYALLAGVSIAAVALTWKGFPYVIGIIFVYAGLQMVIDHWRNRDSTGLFLATLTAFLVGVLLAYPYYALTNTTVFVRPVWFIIGAFFVAGLVLVPTRDLPTLLVMPAAVIVALLGAVVAFFVMPEVANSLLYSTVYFKRTALYETIAEAHPASFSDLAFGIGPIVFLLGVFAWFVALWHVIRDRPTRPLLYALVWGAIALYMAVSAIRFLFNAIPIFAVFAAFGIVWFMDKLDFGAIRRSAQARRGAARGIRPMHVVGALLVVLLLVVPNVLLAADAALPRESEARIHENTDSDFVKGFMANRMGAYGQGFIDDYWHDGLTFLDQYDAAETDPAKRPAFLSWWDYGHWAIAIGRHPAVADNFQNGYEFAANFILSQNETHAIQLMGARLAPLMPRAEVESALTASGVTDARAAYDQLVAWKHIEEMDMAESVAFLSKLEAATQKKIRYFAVDVRMMPYDDPSTPSIEQSSIFYAPVRLKGETADDYVPIKINTGAGRFVTQSEFEEQIRANPTKQISATQERLEFTPKFFNSMYYRAYVGTQVQESQTGITTGDQVIQALNTQQPGIGLQHFRLIYATPELKILEYTPGALVSGTILEEGSPVANAVVTVYDDAGGMLLDNLFTQAKGTFNASDFNVPHAQARTDADGKFEIIAPFSLPDGGVTLVASKDGVELARTTLSIPRADAEAGKTYTAEMTVLKGDVAGLVFEDRDGNGQFNASTDQALPNMTLTIGGQSVTTDGEGRYHAHGISSGTQNVTVESTTYDVAPVSAKVRVRPGEDVTHDVALDLKPGTVEGFLYADVNENDAFDAGEGAGFTAIEFEPDTNVTANPATASTELTDSSGNLSATVKAGTYIVRATFTGPDGTTYTATQPLVVRSGETSTLDMRLRK